MRRGLLVLVTAVLLALATPAYGQDFRKGFGETASRLTVADSHD